jgi:hypothetical protein
MTYELQDEVKLERGGTVTVSIDEDGEIYVSEHFFASEMDYEKVYQAIMSLCATRRTIIAQGERDE